jgi:hypothetical protein
MTPAWKTTEFYLSFANVVCGFLLSAGVFGDGTTAQRILGAILAATGALTHTTARTILKSSAQGATDAGTTSGGGK